ncbi:hypothetical protein KC19_9G166900 [Ceratodon purpureus]|uniref:Secreted protein n=1 Tax=Ceratodon purpureus TaxID=3225 RepID=A0A8T0GX71_CERPU|nr:hypothetical protein KC19_9G166900 [Ceratodon purpureus]
MLLLVTSCLLQTILSLTHLISYAFTYRTEDRARCPVLKLDICVLLTIVCTRCPHIGVCPQELEIFRAIELFTIL